MYDLAHLRHQRGPWLTSLVVAAATTLCLAAACRATPTPRVPATEIAPTPTAPPADAAAYVRYCAVCHGKDGKASTETNSPQLNNPTLLASASDEFFVQNISRGRPGTKMSAFGAENRGPLSETRIRSIVAYLRQWPTSGFGTPEPVVGGGNATAGRKTYQAKCANCHGATGVSETAPDLANPVLQATADDAFLRYAMLHGRPGTKMLPAKLTEQQMADVIAHIRFLGSRSRPVGP